MSTLHWCDFKKPPIKKTVKTEGAKSGRPETGVRVALERVAQEGWLLESSTPRVQVDPRLNKNRPPLDTAARAGEVLEAAGLSAALLLSLPFRSPGISK